MKKDGSREGELVLKGRRKVGSQQIGGLLLFWRIELSGLFQMNENIQLLGKSRSEIKCPFVVDNCVA